MAKNKNQEETQIDLDLPKSKKEHWFRIKRFARNIEKKFTAIPFWQNGLLWFAIVSTIGMTTLSLASIVRNYSSLPPEIPLIYNTQDEMWQSLPRVFIFAFPVSLAIIGILNIRYLQKVYYMNKKMTLMICVIIGLIFIFEFLAINEIILLSTR